MSLRRMDLFEVIIAKGYETDDSHWKALRESIGTNIWK